MANANWLGTLAVCTAVVSGATGCTRIETGEVGVRIGFDKQIQPGELQPGSFNQTVIGDVITFPVKDIAVDVVDLTPLARDNSTMKDLDATVIYSINPAQVSELYVTKNRSFHAARNGDVLLMYNYVQQLARNAIYKAARKHEALLMSDNRQAIENDVKDIITESLGDEKLAGTLSILQVQVRNILPADAVISSANELVRAKNALIQKEVEVKTAKLEAERMAALSNNSGQSIAFMQAQADMKIAEAVAAGKVATIIIPRDFKGMVNVK